MKKFLFLILASLALILPSANFTYAAVLQSANSALSNDIFVLNKKSSAKAKKSIKVQHKTETPAAASEEKPSLSKTKEKEKTDSSSEKTPSHDTQNTNPDAGYGYTKKYASKLFKTFSGHITIEQENIPKRLSVTKGSTIQFNLTETPNAFWNVDLDEKIGKILINQVNGNQRFLVIQAVAPGNTRLFLDHISTQKNKFKVIFNRNMSLLVDE